MSAGPASDFRTGTWGWPTTTRIVLRPFEQPTGEYGPGHRGIDLRADVGAPASAPADGVVAFAGSVAGRPVVTIDFGGGLVGTLDAVAPSVQSGDAVVRGQWVGTIATGAVSAGHCGGVASCLHLGARLDGVYVDPLLYLSAPEWPVLLPLGVVPW
ncbi:murein hydrolase activator EnvC family protein [Curtobacterium sp. RRHDQ10]|uniref:murein hydrolase activator EnvC family protein n=1 Tax=Curtobacterium phyllosphaerae TaxID=3413379 RepID=UPI003BF34970